MLAVRPSLRLRSFARPPATRSLTTTPQLRAIYFPTEPSGPKLATAIPGPNNKKATEELDQVFDVRSLNLLTDFSKSVGN